MLHSIEYSYITKWLFLAKLDQRTHPACMLLLRPQAPPSKFLISVGNTLRGAIAKNSVLNLKNSGHSSLNAYLLTWHLAIPAISSDCVAV